MTINYKAQLSTLQNLSYYLPNEDSYDVYLAYKHACIHMYLYAKTGSQISKMLALYNIFISVS